MKQQLSPASSSQDLPADAAASHTTAHELQTHIRPASQHMHQESEQPIALLPGRPSQLTSTTTTTAHTVHAGQPAALQQQQQQQHREHTQGRPRCHRKGSDAGKSGQEDEEDDMDEGFEDSQSKRNSIYSLKPPSLVNGGGEEAGRRSRRSSLGSIDAQYAAEYGTSGQDLGPLCDWADLPHWMQDNPAILTGYRRQTFSHKKCLSSLWFLHNESAFIIVAPIAYYKVLDVLDTMQWTDVGVFYAFIAGAIICLSMSASFHTFSCHSEPVCLHWNRCDYLGIVFLIVGSFYPAIFYGFYCYPTWQIMYISLISVFGLLTIVAVVRPKFRTPQYRWVRSCLFLAMGLSGLFPVIHGIILYGFPLAREAVALDYMFCMGASYVIGALIYGSRTPERWFPGKVDHFGASHQIFHFCVLLGCLIHFLGVTEAMKFWHQANHACSIPISEMRLAYE
ncbi:hypothetical protein DFQ27_005142 [Actinomortierella ambigua]|uniref:Uncharacterized protein n=1 Tax=Actinomortierella ambigua TaxID=1343610 RepID=A0A9P6Q336_9FUNG|nr:hypothetical protein DFQ27_005142 [Actinomortierella ambigua]